MGRTGSKFESNLALRDIEEYINERGAAVIIRLRGEDDVTRDKYGSIIKRDSVTALNMYAYPIIYNPTEKDLDNAGIREKVEVVIYTPKKTWIDAGVSFEEIDMIRTDVVLDDENSNMNNNQYIIKDMTKASHMVNDYLYIVLGLVRAK